MSSSFMLIVVVVLAVAVAVVVAPLRGKQQERPAARKRPAPGTAYQNTLMALRDLDFDHELGVVTQDDYLRLREELVARAAETMPRKKPDRAQRATGTQTAEGRKEMASPDKSGAASAKKTTEDESVRGNYCPQCGRPCKPEHVFCGKCGTRLSAA